VIAKLEEGEIRLSRGLIWAIGILLTLVAVAVVPWAVRVEHNASAMATTMARIDERSKQWESLASTLTEHLTDPDIHYARLNLIDGKIMSLQRQVDVLETHLDQLQRDVNP